VLYTPIKTGFAVSTSVLWWIDDSVDVVLPFMFFAFVMFVAVNLAFNKPSSGGRPKY
jgi:hypothetical protein